MPAGYPAQPFTVLDRLKPVHRGHGLLGMKKVRMIPEWRRRMAGGLEKGAVVAVPHRKDSEEKLIHPDAMHRPLFVAALLASHQEVSRPHRHTNRLDQRHQRTFDSCSSRRLVLDRELLHLVQKRLIVDVEDLSG